MLAQGETPDAARARIIINYKATSTLLKATIPAERVSDVGPEISIGAPAGNCVNTATAGPPFNAVPFRPADVVATPVGGDRPVQRRDSGILSYNVSMPGGSAAQNEAITREVFRAGNGVSVAA